MNRETHKVRTPHFPCYSTVRQLLRIWVGTRRQAVAGMLKTLAAQTGTPRKPMIWSDPDSWIGKRLGGEDAVQARRIWEKSDRSVNPRHVYGAYLFINTYDLLTENVFGDYQLTPNGKAFLDNDSSVVGELDDREGLPQLLGILAGKSTARRGDLLPEWEIFLREHSGFRSPATIRETLRLRLLNLMERGFVSRRGLDYSITRKGIEYADRRPGTGLAQQRELIRAVTAHNRDRLAELHDRLLSLPASRFEKIIREFLAALGYENVTTAKDNGAHGLELTATTLFGIVTVPEVFLIISRQGSCGVADLKRLRDAISRHQADRGSLLTLGKLTRECRTSARAEGQQPVRLLDGKRLLELMAAQQIGVRGRRLTMYQLDEDVLGTDLSSLS